jgi:hypothetical protein
LYFTNIEIRNGSSYKNAIANKDKVTSTNAAKSMQNTKDNTGNKEKKKIPRLVRIAIGIFVGAGLGYAYYYFIGCSSGSCPITSNPWNSTIAGMVLGAVWTIK